MKTMPSSRGLGSISDLKNLFPTKTHFLIFVGYMALFISQGLWANLPHLIRFLILNKQKTSLIDFAVLAFSYLIFVV